jgi:hypothetical protein
MSRLTDNLPEEIRRDVRHAGGVLRVVESVSTLPTIAMVQRRLEVQLWAYRFMSPRFTSFRESCRSYATLRLRRAARRTSFNLKASTAVRPPRLQPLSTSTTTAETIRACRNPRPTLYSTSRPVQIIRSASARPQQWRTSCGVSYSSR